MLLRNLRHSVRAMLHNPGFAMTALLTLAVCFGANATIFTIVYSVLLRPLPVPEPDRLVLISNRYPKAGAADSTQSGAADYFERREAVRSLSDHALYRSEGVTLDMKGSPQRVTGMTVTPSFFGLVRTQPALGRAFTEQEGEAGNELKVILSDGLWRQMFGGDPGALRKSVRMGGREFAVVGVMPRGFQFMDPEVVLWIPLAFSPEAKQARHNNNWHFVGRMKPGVKIAQVQAEVDALNRANLERYPRFREVLLNAGYHSPVEPLEWMLIRDVQRTLTLLWGGALLVVLIGVVNLANVSLARLQARGKELATRLALGASRGQLTAQLLGEQLTLAIVGGAVGLGLAAVVVRNLELLGLDRLPRASEIRVDGTVAAAGFAVAAMVGLLLGLIAVVHTLGVNVNQVLHENSRGGTAGLRARALRQGMVIGQVALAFVLLLGSGLLLASFRNLLGVDPGFRVKDVALAATVLPSSRYGNVEAQRLFHRRLLEAVRAVPGVVSAGTTTTVPLGGNGNDSVLIPEGYVLRRGESLISPKNLVVSPGYLESMNLALLQGRYFGERDDEKAEPAVIVDRQLADRFWPGQNPLGKRVRFPADGDDLMRVTGDTRWMRVVGVVRTARLWDLSQAGSAVGVAYLPHAQTVRRSFTVALGTNVDAASMTPAIRAAVARLDPELAVFDTRTMEERVRLSLASRRMAMNIATGFSALALFLSAVGIYGVLAYLVANRAREIGIRMAVGSTEGAVFRMILGEGGKLVACGLVLGLGGALALRAAVATQLFGVGMFDPLVVGGVTVLLGLVALAACGVPALRAMRVDPTRVLTQQ
ncbi:MAG: ABC transporter permease [Bryobacterales bacterium]|nr:ABC transporter permease [Bryobacterales bacterium]